MYFRLVRVKPYPLQWRLTRKSWWCSRNCNASEVFSSDRTGARTSVGRRQLATPSISRSGRLHTPWTNKAMARLVVAMISLTTIHLMGIFNNWIGCHTWWTNRSTANFDWCHWANYSLNCALRCDASWVYWSFSNAVTKWYQWIYRNYLWFYETRIWQVLKSKGKVFYQNFQSQTGVSIGGPIIKTNCFSLRTYKTQEKILVSHGPNRGTGGIKSRVLEMIWWLYNLPCLDWVILSLRRFYPWSWFNQRDR